MTALGERCENGFSDAGSIPAAFTSVTLDPIRFGFGVIFCPFFLPQTAAKRFRFCGASGSQKPFVDGEPGVFQGFPEDSLKKWLALFAKSDIRIAETVTDSGFLLASPGAWSTAVSFFTRLLRCNRKISLDFFGSYGVYCR